MDLYSLLITMYGYFTGKEYRKLKFAGLNS